MLFLTNDHIKEVLDMHSCIEVMEDAYRELNEGHAGYRPRIDFYVPQEPHYYRWGTMEGVSRKRVTTCRGNGLCSTFGTDSGLVFQSGALYRS